MQRTVPILAAVLGLSPISAWAASAAQPAKPATGCVFMSSYATEVRVYADDSRHNDEGDLLQAFALEPGVAGPVINPTDPASPYIRYRYRTSRTDAWTYVSSTACRSGAVIRV